MTNFLFWNFNRPNQEKILTNAIVQHDIDVVMLAESNVSTDEMMSELSRRNVELHAPLNIHPRFEIYTRFRGEFLEPIVDHPRMSIRRLCLPKSLDIIVAIIHFYDRRNYSTADQHSEAIREGSTGRKLMEEKESSNPGH